MTLSKDTKTTWPELDPDVLERIVPDTKGFIAFDDLRAESQTLAPGLEVWHLGTRYHGLRCRHPCLETGERFCERYGQTGNPSRRKPAASEFVTFRANSRCTSYFNDLEDLRVKFEQFAPLELAIFLSISKA